MIKLILSIAGAVGAIATLALFLVKKWYSKEAEKRREIDKTDMDDPSSITSTFDKLIILVVVCISLSGCNQIVLHPIQDTDIVRVKQGETLTAPKDGYYLSNFYLKAVMKAKVR